MSPSKHSPKHPKTAAADDEPRAPTAAVESGDLPPPASTAPEPAPAEVIEPVTLADASTLADPTPFLRAMNEAAKRLAKDGATLGVKVPEGAARKHLAAFLAECVGGEK